MNQGKAVFLVRVAVILGLALWAPGAQAFWPPCQQVTASLEGTAPNQTVHYQVKDDKKGALVYGVWTPPQPMSISSPAISRGMVFWQTTVSSSDFRVYCRVYDPGRSSWQGDEWLSTEYPAGLKGGDGVITWMAPAGYPNDKCVVRTYDPGSGVWKGGEKVFVGNTGTLVTYVASSGVVAWSMRTLSGEDVASVYFGIYDPSRGEWRFGDDQISLQAGDQMPGLVINAGTVVFSNLRFNYHYGYDPASGAWSRDHDTQPLSWFAAQPTVGKAPLWVWFTDMSFGGPTLWTFGDGTPSIWARSPSYTYGSIGKFTVTQQVGDSLSSQEIRVHAGADLTPAVDLLLLE